MSYSTRRTAEEWWKIVRAQQKSDQTVSSFCRQQGIKEGTFYYWRSKIDRREEFEEGFISLRPQPSGSGVIVLRCGGGLALELPQDYSVSALSQLIRSLRC